MPRRCIFILMLACPLAAQTVVQDAAQREAISARFDHQPSERTLSCRISLQSLSGSTFGIREGYRVDIPAADRRGGNGNSWVTTARIVAEGRSREPVFMTEPYNLDVVLANPDYEPLRRRLAPLAWNGWFAMGEGRYRIDLRVSDDIGRICRKEFRIHAHSALPVALPPGMVVDLSVDALANELAHDPRPHLRRLTLLLDAAPQHFLLNYMPSKLSEADRSMLLEGIIETLREIPTESIRLICFSLDRGRVVFRDRDFNLGSIGHLEDALKALDFSVVDASIVSHPGGYLDLLGQLIQDQVQADPPPDAVIFLGPQERFRDSVSPEPLETREGAPAFFYLRYAVSGNANQCCDFVPDGTIAKALYAMHGKVVDLRFGGPVGLAQAVERIRSFLFPR